MGDVVNVAARLSAKARWGTILTTEGVLRRSRTRFATTPVPPFMVKGKSRPIDAFEVENALRAAPLDPAAKRLPLIGRDLELEILRGAVNAALAGDGVVVELVGETGSGKSRLLTEAREFATGMRSIHVTCETYTQTIPYYPWHDPLRQLLGLTWEDAGAPALERLRAHLELFSHNVPAVIALCTASVSSATRTVSTSFTSPHCRHGMLDVAV
jgi:hypothetical protein